MSDINNDLLNIIIQNQRELQARLERIEQKLNNIEKDIYLEDDDTFDLEIVCPYCNNEFIVDMDEDRTEVTCPECNNVIELDWAGDVEEEGFGCAGGCSGCRGCSPEEDDM
jgi:uncharacterized Zn-finger protein